MTKIICLIGASGSGKTMVAKELDKRGYNIVHSYTTRKPREENEWGHIFIEGELSNCNSHLCTTKGSFYRSDMIAYFNNYKGTIYFATEEQIKKGETNIYIVDPIGSREVKEHYKDNKNVEVISIYLQADEEVRARRMTGRVTDKTQLAYIKDLKTIPEIADRIVPDRKIFKLVQADYTLNANRSKESVLKDIIKIIK